MYGCEELETFFKGLQQDDIDESFFSDEKIFTTKQAFNSRNHGIWATESPGDSSLVERKQKPKFMV